MATIKCGITTQSGHGMVSCVDRLFAAGAVVAVAVGDRSATERTLRSVYSVPLEHHTVDRRVGMQRLSECRGIKESDLLLKARPQRSCHGLFAALVVVVVVVAALLADGGSLCTTCQADRLHCHRCVQSEEVTTDSRVFTGRCDRLANSGCNRCRQHQRRLTRCLTTQHTLYNTTHQ